MLALLEKGYLLFPSNFLKKLRSCQKQKLRFCFLLFMLFLFVLLFFEIKSVCCNTNSTIWAGE